MLGAVLAVVLGLGVRAHAQTLPLEDKARFEKALEEKAESFLLKVLGPNRARVMVDATLDFTRVERLELVAGKGKQEEAGQPPALFAWQQLSAQSAGFSELLPGIPLPGTLTAGSPQSYERRSGYAPSFVKRLTIRVFYDRSVAQQQQKELDGHLMDLLGFEPSRDDLYKSESTSFAPLWRTMWYSPDSFSVILRYSLLTLMALITLGVVTFCFIKLANAMEAMASAQTDYGIDLTGEDRRLASAAQESVLEGPQDGEKKMTGGEAAEKNQEEEPIIINVRDNQVPILIHLIFNESAENIALVVSHLREDRRRQVLAKLPRDVEAQVLVWLSEVKLVEPELIGAIKEELERRLATAVGGMEQVCEIIEGADPPTKKEIFEALRLANPELALEVRSRVLLLDDLIKLGGPEWSLLMGRIRLEDWAVALAEAPRELRPILRSNMGPKTWEIFERTMATAVLSKERVAQAQGTILGEVWKMIHGGLIANPLGLVNTPALPRPASEDQGAPAAAA